MTDRPTESVVPNALTRRSLLKWTSAATGAVLLSACDGADPAASVVDATPVDAPEVDRPDVGNSPAADVLVDVSVDAGVDASVDVAATDAPIVCTLDAGPVGDYPTGTYRVFLSQHVIVGRDVGGLYAFTSVCTHEGCDVPAPDASGDIVCPCHGSRFDSNGDVTGGPAKSSLIHVPVAIRADGRVCVATTVIESDRARRTPVT